MNAIQGIENVKHEASGRYHKWKLPKSWAKTSIITDTKRIPVTLLCDSGNMCFSCISTTLFQKLSLPLIPVQTSTVGTANSESKLRILGKCKITMIFEDIPTLDYVVYAMVSEDLNNDFNLSNFDLANLGFMQDYSEGILYTEEGHAITLYSDQNCQTLAWEKKAKNTEHINVVTENDTTLLPGTVTYADCKILNTCHQPAPDGTYLCQLNHDTQSKMSDNVTVFPIHSRNLNNIDHQIINTVHSISQIQLVNPTQRQILVRKNQPIASGIQISDSDINAITKRCQIDKEKCKNFEITKRAEDTFTGETLSNKASHLLNKQNYSERSKFLTVSLRLLESPYLAGDDTLLQKLLVVLHSNWQVYGRPNNPGNCTLGKIDIPTRRNIPPIRQKMRNIAPNLIEAGKPQIKEWLQSDMIEKSESPWAANPVIIPKKDGQIRFCIDYTSINKYIRFDSWPLPNISSLWRHIYNKKYLSSLDLKDAFNSIQLSRESREKTAFYFDNCLYQFKVLPYGLKIGTAKFSQLINKALEKHISKCCFAFVDDIIIFSETAEEHLQHLNIVMSDLNKAGFRIKIAKSSLFCETVIFLGTQIRYCNKNKKLLLEIPEEYTKVIKNWPTPQTVSDLRRFMGKCSYHRNFIPHFTQISSPLSDLLKGSKSKDKKKLIPIKDNPAALSSFNNLKQAMLEAVRLAIPCFDKNDPKFGPMIVDVDWSHRGISGCLSQLQAGVEVPLGYTGRKCSPREQTYSSTIGELISLLWAGEAFRFYLTGNHFYVRTDSLSLTFIRGLKHQTLKHLTAKWLLFLSEYDFSIIHRRGEYNINADTISRCNNLPELSPEESETLYQDNFQSIFQINYQHNPLHEYRKFIVPDQIAKQDKHNNNQHISSTDTQSLSTIQHTNQQLPKPTMAINVPMHDITPPTPPQDSPTADSDTHSSSDRSVNTQTNADHAVVNNAIRYEPPTSLVNFASILENDSDIKQVIFWKAHSAQPDKKGYKLLSRTMKLYYALLDQLVIEKIGQKHILHLQTPTSRLLVIPDSIVDKLIMQVHLDLKHSGRDVTLATLKTRYFFPFMPARTKACILMCSHCDQLQPAPKSTQKFFYTNDNSGFVWEKCCLDHVIMTQSPSGCKYILTVMCNFSKYVELYPTDSLSAETTAHILFTQFIPTHGLPHQFHSDRSGSFTSRLTTTLWQLLNVRVTFTAPYSPQSNSIERMHSNLKRKLKRMIHDTTNITKDWQQCLPMVKLAINSSVHCSTKFSPFYVLYGREPLLSHELLFGPPEKIPNSIGQHITKLWKIMRTTHETVRVTFGENNERVDKLYDPYAYPYRIGSLTWLFTPALKENKNLSQKLGKVWTGPFEIVKFISKVTITIRPYGNWSMDNKTQTVSVNNLRPCRMTLEEINNGLPISLTSDDIVSADKPPEFGIFPFSIFENGDCPKPNLDPSKSDFSKWKLEDLTKAMQKPKDDKMAFNKEFQTHNWTLTDAEVQICQGPHAPVNTTPTPRVQGSSNRPTPPPPAHSTGDDEDQMPQENTQQTADNMPDNTAQAEQRQQHETGRENETNSTFEPNVHSTPAHDMDILQEPNLSFRNETGNATDNPSLPEDDSTLTTTVVEKPPDTSNKNETARNQPQTQQQNVMAPKENQATGTIPKPRQPIKRRSEPLPPPTARQARPPQKRRSEQPPPRQQRTVTPQRRPDPSILWWSPPDFCRYCTTSGYCHRHCRICTEEQKCNRHCKQCKGFSKCQAHCFHCQSSNSRASNACKAHKSKRK